MFRILPSSAVDGTGVIETLTACCKLVFKQMDSSGSAKKRRRQQQDEAAPLPANCADPIRAITSRSYQADCTALEL